jgi:hypothetical protein
VAACTAKADDVPLRCVDAADPAELAAWPRELYHAGGKVYRPVTKVVMHQDTRPVMQLQEQPDVDGVPQPPQEVQVQEPYERPEKVLDEEATLAAGPATPPRTIPHVHSSLLDLRRNLAGGAAGGRRDGDVWDTALYLAAPVTPPSSGLRLLSRLICARTERWSTRGVGAAETPAWERWGHRRHPARDTGESTERWRTSGIAFATLDFVERWITFGISGELVFDEGWSTVVPQVRRLLPTLGFAVRGITIAELPAWDRWETEGAPGNITLFDEAWVTAAPVLRTMDDWEQWATHGLELAYLVADESWETPCPGALHPSISTSAGS